MAWIAFATGFTSILLQVLWSKVLAFTLGSGLLAINAVILAFMLGLAIGPLCYRYFAASYSSKRILILAQFLIVTINLLIICIFFFNIKSHSHSYGFLSLFLVVANCIPMGLVIPSLQGMIRSQNTINTLSSKLYSYNLFGAALAALLGGTIAFLYFKLITLSLIVAALDLLIILPLVWYKGGLNHEPELEGVMSPLEKSNSTDSIDDKLILSLIFTQGILSFGFELYWLRIFSSIIGKTVFTYSNILFLFLLGTGVGTFLGRRLVFNKKVTLVASVALMMISFSFCISTLNSFSTFSLFLFNFCKIFFSNFLSYFISQLIFLAIVIFPVAILIGFQFHYFLRLKQDSLWTAKVLKISSLGNIIGVILFGLLLLPHVDELWVDLSLLLLMTFLLVTFLKLSQIRYQKLIAPVLTFSLFTLVLISKDPSSTFSGGLYFLYPKKLSSKDLTSLNGKLEVTIPGSFGNLTVMSNPSNNGAISLRSGGKHVASSEFLDRGHLSLLGHLPVLLAKSIDKVAVVGLGTGLTSSQLKSYKSIKSVDIFELESGMVKIQPYFSFINDNYLEDERFNVILKDGRNGLNTKNLYDVITSDPVSPFIKGSSSLYTQEYYEQVKNSLKENGVFAQWVQGVGISSKTLRSFFYTFQNTFKNTLVFQYEDDFILIGILGEGASQSQLISRLQNPEVKVSLNRQKINGLGQIADLFLGALKPLRIHSEVELITDNYQFLEVVIPFETLSFKNTQYSLKGEISKSLISKGHFINKFKSEKGSPLLEGYSATNSVFYSLYNAREADQLSVALQKSCPRPDLPCYFTFNYGLAKLLLDDKRYEDAVVVLKDILTEFPAYKDSYALIREHRDELARFNSLQNLLVRLRWLEPLKKEK